jgi:hypothetical protein
MPNQINPTIETFVRFVEERYRDFMNKLSEMMSSLAAEDKQQKLARAKVTLDAANSLQQSLALQDQPQWLQPITNALQNYVSTNGHPAHANELIRSIGYHFGKAEGHKWAFDFSEEKGFDFDGVFRKFESESRIPDLFDKIVELLEKIVLCDDLDSRKVVHTLESIIATLKKNRNGSYFGVMGSWDFVGTYLNKLAWSIFLEIPVLKVFVKPLRETLDEMNKEMDKLHENMQAELHSQLQAEFPVLEYHHLPIPEPLLLADETIIDVEATLVSDQDNKPS